MNKTFEQENFEAAIREKNYIKLKNYVINSIRNNPGFVCVEGKKISEAEEAFKRLNECREELPELFTEYKLQNGEEKYDKLKKNLCTQEYFIKQTFFLRENFCPERFEYIKEVGRVLSEEKHGDSSNQNKKIPMLVILVIVAAILALLAEKIIDLN